MAETAAVNAKKNLERHLNIAKFTEGELLAKVNQARKVLKLAEISELTKHLQEHKKDQSARRGLLGKVSQRRRLLTYLKMNNPDAYQQVLETQKLNKQG